METPIGAAAPGGLRIAALLAACAAALAFGPHDSGSLPADRLGPHGALALDAQRERVRELLPERDVTQPPEEIDVELWELRVPGDNAMTPERVALGEALYFDARLSRDGTVACATCHDVSRGFTDQRPVSEGIGGALGRRNAPTTMNALFYQDLFLDGRVASLESQAGFPPINSVEGGHPDRNSVVAAIQGDAKLQEMFRAAYDAVPNYEDMVRAIAAYERTLIFMDSPLDAFLAGDPEAISDSAKRGFALFNGKGRCVGCHQIYTTNALGTDNLFHNIGVAARTKDFEKLAGQALAALGKQGGSEAVDELALKTDLSELGRFLVTKDRADIGAFKTQGIRNVGVTAPYMHDGSMRTLWDVMDHYNKGGEANPYLDGGIEPLALSEAEISDLVALMFSMTDRRFAEQGQEEFEAQRTIAAERRPFRDDDLAMRRTLPFEQRVQSGGSGSGAAREGE